MKKRFFLAVILVTLLAGCVQRYPHRPSSAPNPQRPMISIVENVVIVDQEPIFFPASLRNRETPVTWHLPVNSPFTFDPRAGIVIDAPQGEFVNCAASKDGKEFTCINRHTRPGKYRYQINLLRNGERFTPVDPTVMNG